MKELDIVIEEIIKQYSIINDCLKQANFYSPMNLKRKTVRNIYGDDDFYIYISKLRDYLNDIITESSNSIINCQSSYRVTTRVKTLNSIQYKIRNYYLNHENGNIPIKKCLNDIFGIRIILLNILMRHFLKLKLLIQVKWIIKRFIFILVMKLITHVFSGSYSYGMKMTNK